MRSTRRVMLASTWTLGAAPADPRASRPQVGDRLVSADGGITGPITPDALPVGGPPALAWPVAADGTVRDGARANQILLLRLDPAAMDAATRERSAGGVVAYGALCSHAGCVVKAWQEAEAVLQCPCHNSRYDPRRAAAVVFGPAPRPLAALPLAIEDGLLVVAGPFVGRVGPAAA